MRTNQRERANIGGGSNGETHTGRGQAHAGDADRRRSTAGRRLYPGWPRELRRSEPWREQRHGGRLLALRQLGSSLVASGPAVGSPSRGPQRNARRNLWFDLRPPDASTHVPAVDPIASSGKTNNTGCGANLPSGLIHEFRSCTGDFEAAIHGVSTEKLGSGLTGLVLEGPHPRVAL